MSDFDRNAAAAQYGAPLTRAEAAVVDEGLRAYMLRIYNYMVLGLAITGFAALGIYMLSVTSDPTLAYQGARPLARVIQKEVRDVLTDQILFGALEHGGTVTIDLADDRLTFAYEDRA